MGELDIATAIAQPPLGDSCTRQSRSDTTKRLNACGYIISDTQRLPTYNGNNVRNHVLPGASSGALGECQAARKDARQSVGCSDGQGPGGPDHAPHWIGIIQCGDEQALGPRGPQRVLGGNPGPVAGTLPHVRPHLAVDAGADAIRHKGPCVCHTLSV